jgi:RluA family pseudouridine synthase
VVDLPAPAPTQDIVDLSDAVLYRDDYVLAINKPAWLATHATRDAARDHALAGVERILRAEGRKDARVAVHHRLDVETSGVLIFGIHPDANKGLGAAFSERLAQKTYVAVTALGEANDTWTVDNHLGKDSSGRRDRSVVVTSGGDHALTEFTVKQRLDDALVIECKPHTGRMHQIRVHLADSGLPIIGDTLYGGPRHWHGRKADRMLLHAWKLEIPHPVTGKPLCIEAELPAEFDTER